jgi:hypothetical protein
MISSTTTRSVVFLAIAGSLALAATAYAAPAGDEYLPKVPDATGSQSGDGQRASGTGGGGGETAAPVAGSSIVPDTVSTGTPGGAGDEGGSGKKQAKGKEEPEASATPAVATETASADDDSSGLFDPRVLLIVAGVMIAAVGMTLRHRAAGMEETATDGGRSDRDRGEAPRARPTPDGEIVAGGDKS